MTTTDKALHLAVKMVISQEWPKCEDVCPRTVDRCEALPSLEWQKKKCVRPLKAWFLKQAGRKQ